MRGLFTLNGELGSVQRKSFTVNCEEGVQTVVSRTGSFLMRGCSHGTTKS